jgi:tRNA A-37 threonylcarbamoyl transferase component Bud32
LADLIASGRSADVFEAGPGRVLIRYREPRDVRGLAALIRRVVAAGYPAPHVFEVGTNDLVMERIDGPTMFEDLLRHPNRMEDHAAALADLHSRLHRLGIIHRDLHPLNVILTGLGPVVIDWEAAREGDGALDLAETWVLLATTDIPAEIRPEAHRFLEAFLEHVDREGARLALPAVVARRRVDPHKSPDELTRMDELLAAEGLGD